MREYAAIYEPGPRNCSAYSPDVPDRIATGETRHEAEHAFREALAFHLDGLRAHGEHVPEPACEVGAVKIAA
jgi:predicted RNase H-like HicB family nuclease